LPSIPSRPQQVTELHLSSPLRVNAAPMLAIAVDDMSMTSWIEAASRTL
jgi:hypothetical protein